MNSGQVKFLSSNAVHFFSNNRLDLEKAPPRQRKLRINSGAQLSDEAGSQ
jgi:hypothetical protein